MNYAQAFNSQDILGIEDIGDSFERVSRQAKLAFGSMTYTPFDEMVDTGGSASLDGLDDLDDA